MCVCVRVCVCACVCVCVCVCPSLCPSPLNAGLSRQLTSLSLPISLTVVHTHTRSDEHLFTLSPYTQLFRSFVCVCVSCSLSLSIKRWIESPINFSFSPHFSYCRTHTHTLCVHTRTYTHSLTGASMDTHCLDSAHTHCLYNSV